MSVPIVNSPFVFTFVNSYSFFEKCCIVMFGSFILALSGNISIPLYPVPFSFQSYVVLLIGSLLGHKLGVLVVLETIILGFLGLPVFAGGTNSIVALTSPSAGYIYGFILSVYITGWASKNGLDRKWNTGLLSFIVANQSIFLLGVTYLSFFLNISLKEALILGYVPFVLFDFIKVVLATLTMKTLWSSPLANWCNSHRAS